MDGNVVVFIGGVVVVDVAVDVVGLVLVVGVVVVVVVVVIGVVGDVVVVGFVDIISVIVIIGSSVLVTFGVVERTFSVVDSISAVLLPSSDIVNISVVCLVAVLFVRSKDVFDSVVMSVNCVYSSVVGGTVSEDVNNSDVVMSVTWVLPSAVVFSVVSGDVSGSEVVAVISVLSPWEVISVVRDSVSPVGVAVNSVVSAMLGVSTMSVGAVVSSLSLVDSGS